MIGLEIEINKRKPKQKSPALELLGISNIARTLNMSYQLASYKIKNNKFYIYEVLKIFRECIPPDEQTFDYFIYLFTEQGWEDEKQG